MSHIHLSQHLSQMLSECGSSANIFIENEEAEAQRPCPIPSEEQEAGQARDLGPSSCHPKPTPTAGMSGLEEILETVLGPPFMGEEASSGRHQRLPAFPLCPSQRELDMQPESPSQPGPSLPHSTRILQLLRAASISRVLPQGAWAEILSHILDTEPSQKRQNPHELPCWRSTRKKASVT